MIPVEVLAGELIKAADRDCQRATCHAHGPSRTSPEWGGTVLARPLDTYARRGRWTYGDHDNNREPAKAEVDELTKGAVAETC